LSVCSNGSTKLVTYGSKATIYSAAVASPATAKLACDAGIATSKNDKLQLVAGLRADTDTLTVLQEPGMPLSLTVIKAVALAGRLSVMQQLLPAEQCPRSDSVSHYVARRGSIINWFIARSQTGLHDDTCARAAVAGQHVQLLQFRAACIFPYTQGGIEHEDWLQHKDGLQPDASVMAMAASGGHTAVCEYLRSIGCAWSTSACCRAAGRGHLDMLRWLRDHGCPWDLYDMCVGAVCNGSTDILDYVTERGEVIDADLLTEALAFADKYNQQQVVEWLERHGAQ
jgi:hypothetical protein